MSVLLERMIQRTRAPLSSLEPLSEPNFGPVRRIEPGLDQHLDEHVAGLPDEGFGAGLRHAGLRYARPRHAGLRSAGERRTGPRGGSGLEPLPGAPAAARAGAGRTAPARPEPAAIPRPDLAAAEPGTRDEAGLTWPAGRDLGEAGDIAEPGGRLAWAGPAGNQEAAPAAGTADAWPLPPVAPARRWAEHPSAPPGPAGLAADTPGAGPRVTVSIGHIEVRPGPASEKPAPRPPFRPQVGLADFLSQPRDRRS